MPAPIAKGIVITVSVLVAAGIAVYESPQVKQWIDSSRRKIAIAFQGYGADEGSKEDVSMTEELGHEAEQRRRKAREEIMQRGELLKSYRERRNTASTSFDTLVDKDGHLKKSEAVTPETGEGEPSFSSRATGIDTQATGLTHRHQDADAHTRERQPDLLAEDFKSEQNRSDTLEPEPRNRLRLDIPSAPSSTHPSESLVDLTPTSEFPDTDLEDSHHTDAEQVPQDQLSQQWSMSPISSSHTEDGDPDFYYAHPDHMQNSSTQGPHAPHSRSAGMDELREYMLLGNESTAATVGSSVDRIEPEHVGVAGSDGTLSDDGELVRDVHTPISWSEVGSAVSSNDGSHQ